MGISQFSVVCFLFLLAERKHPLTLSAQPYSPVLLQRTDQYEEARDLCSSSSSAPDWPQGFGIGVWPLRDTTSSEVSANYNPSSTNPGQIFVGGRGDY